MPYRDPAAKAANAAARYAANPGPTRARAAAWRAAHLEEARADDRVYSAAHPRTEYKAAWTQTHREKVNARNAAWRKTHPSRRVRIALVGERVNVLSLPIELQPVALAIREVRRLIRQRRRDGN